MATQRRSIRLSGSRSTLDSDILRQRQTKRDETIRKKLEQEILKRGPSTRIRTTQRGSLVRGWVVKASVSVMEATQLMAAKKCHCLLVMNQQEQLCGILTAKDIAYRVVATSRSGLLVSEVMTPDPVRVTMDTQPHEALLIMIARGFRHVPVCSNDGNIMGLLDISACLYEVLETMERVFGSSQRFLEALQGVEKEWMPISVSSSTTTEASLPIPPVWMDSLRNKMTCPDVSSLLHSESTVIQVSVKASVHDVVRLMREHGTTAVLVMDHDLLVGIFCTKDLVLRVLAAGLKPETCSVVRVMTPEPEIVSPDTTLIQALKKMHDGHYLNLPVVDKDKTILGMIDVLTLTDATLELINTIKSTADGLYPCDDTLTLDTESTTSMTSYPTHKELSSGLSSTIKPTTEFFTFKFTHLGKTYRFRSYGDRFDALHQTIRQRLGRDGFTVYYRDDDNDRVVITCDADVVDAVRMAQGQDRALLIVVFEEAVIKVEKDETKCAVCHHLLPMTLLGVLLLGVFRAKSYCRFKM